MKNRLDNLLDNRPERPIALAQALSELEAGWPIERIVANHALDADELRMVLTIASDLRASSQAVRVPVTAQAMSKARFLAAAEQRRSRGGLAGFWQRLQLPRFNLGAVTFTLATIALLLVAMISTRALPGDSLYPMKLAAEQASLSLVDDPAGRITREEAYDQNRVSEIQTLLLQNRENPVNFAGYLLRQPAGEWTVAGIPLQILPEMNDTALELSGVYVEINGHTHTDRQVHVEVIQPRLFQFEGVITEGDENGWMVGNLLVRVTQQTRLRGAPVVGSRVKVDAARMGNQTQVLAFRIEVVVQPPEDGIHKPVPLPRQENQAPLPSPTISDSATEESNISETPTPVPSPEDEDGQDGNQDEDNDEDNDDDDHDEEKKDKNPKDSRKPTRSDTHK